MNIKIQNTHHGYLTLPRQAKLLLQELGPSLFGFYLGLVMEANWFRGHKNFGRITKTQVELANELNITQETISRKFKKLEKHSYCVLRHKGEGGILLGYFPLFIKDVASKMLKKNYANLGELYADMYKINTEMQEDYTFLQDNQTPSTSHKLNSSSNVSISSREDVGY